MVFAINTQVTALLLFVECWVDFVEENRGLARFLFAADGEDSAGRGDLSHLFQEIVHWIGVYSCFSAA